MHGRTDGRRGRIANETWTTHVHVSEQWLAAEKSKETRPLESFITRDSPRVELFLAVHSVANLEVARICELGELTAWMKIKIKIFNYYIKVIIIILIFFSYIIRY